MKDISSDPINEPRRILGKLIGLGEKHSRKIGKLQALLFLVTLAAVPLQGQFTSGDFTYTVDADEVTITKIACGATQVTVPGTIEGLPVTAIAGNALRSCTSVESIVFPDSLKFIGSGAFSNCRSLASVLMKDGVETIEPGAFGNCPALASFNLDPANPNFSLVDESLFSKDMTRLLWFNPSKTGHYTVPASVSTIDSQAFSGSQIESVTIPEGVTALNSITFHQCGSLVSVELPQSLLSIGITAFGNCRKLKTINFPNNLKSIGRWAFSGCREIESIVIPDSVTSVGEFAFASCSSLATVQMSENLEELGRGAFRSCGNLTSLNLPASLRLIGDYPFEACRRLVELDLAAGNPYFNLADGAIFSEDMTELIMCLPSTTGDYVIPESVTTLRVGAFRTGMLTSVVIHDGITELPWATFDGCSELVSVTLPDTLTTMGNAVFYDCASLESIHIPSSVSSMGNQMFRYNDSLTEVTLPDSIEHLGYEAFANCASLVEITIPASIKTMGYRVFKDSNSLQRVIFEGSPPVVEDSENFWPETYPTVYYFPEAGNWKETLYGAPTTAFLNNSFWPTLPRFADNWMISDWYGWMQDYDSWVWHLEHGWQTFVGESNDSFFVYDRGLENWFYANSVLYPFIYIYGADEGWYQYTLGGTPGQRWFIKWATLEWKSESSFRQ
ncbi:MAG: leucine-rich repeat domain-containing protein [Puniceicoccaceae bacterium]